MKIKAWFPSIMKSDIVNGLQIYKYHETLVDSYKVLNAEQDKISQNLGEFERIRNSQSIDIVRINEWLTALKQHGTDEKNLPNISIQYQVHILEQYKQIYINNINSITKCGGIKSKKLTKLRKKYDECLQQKLFVKEKEDSAIFDQYLKRKPSASLETILFLASFNNYLLQLLHFEKVKYMYLLLLSKKINNSQNLFGNTIKNYHDKYMRANDALETIAANYHGHYYGDFTEQEVLVNQLFGLQQIHAESLQLPSTDETLRYQKNTYFNESLTPKLRQFKNELPIHSIYPGQRHNLVFDIDHSRHFQKLQTVQKIA